MPYMSACSPEEEFCPEEQVNNFEGGEELGQQQESKAVDPLDQVNTTAFFQTDQGHADQENPQERIPLSRGFAAPATSAYHIQNRQNPAA